MGAVAQAKCCFGHECSKGETTTNAIIERITEYQRLGNQDLFGDEIPQMTERAQGLIGVSVASPENR